MVAELTASCGMRSKTGAGAATVTTAITNAKTAGVPPRYLAPLEEAAKGIK